MPTQRTSRHISPRICSGYSHPEQTEDHDHELIKEVNDVEGDEAQAGVRRPIKINDPKLPSQEEIDEHMTTHLPYRNWCTHCVRGKGKSADHKQQMQDERIIPEFHMDYLFMGTAAVKASKDDKAATILGVKMKDRKAHMATVVPKKGASMEFVAKRVNKFIDEMGFKESTVMFKTDQEPSIVDLVNAIKKLRAGLETHSENSPVASSASNGVMERGVQSIEGMIRVLKDALEYRLGIKIGPQSLVLSWLVEYSAVLINRYEVGHDGKTPYERARGKVSKMLGVEFGERLMFRRQPIGQRLAKLESLWEVGIYTGYKAQTGEHMVNNKDGAFVTRTIKRMPEEIRWNETNLEMIVSTPWSLSPTSGAGAGEQEIMPAIQVEMKEPEVEIIPPRSREEQAVPRRLYIGRRDLEAHGHTTGCAGCTAILMKKNPVAHNDECRNKIEAKINETAKGKRRAHEVDERQKHFLAKAIEDSDKIKKMRTSGPGEVAPIPSSSSTSRPGHMDVEDEDKMKDTEQREVGSKMKRDTDDDSNEHQIPDDLGIRYIDSNKEKWGDIESEDENTKWTNDLSYMEELYIMEMTCEEKHDDQWDTCFEDGKINSEVFKWQEIFDDVTGKKLINANVQAARQNELDELDRLKVYEKVNVDECWKHTGRAPITARWIDINKGDEVDLNYRSRYVAREIKGKYGGDDREGLFAATPPWEATKIMISNLATGHTAEKKIMFIDISKAYLFAPAVHEHIYVDLPPEHHVPGQCGRLLKALYGTRAAAHAWEQEYTRTLTSLGFVAGAASSCVFTHPITKLEMVVHGDDFTVAGSEDELKKFAHDLGQVYIVKVRGVLGSNRNDLKEITLLNRCITWHDDHISIEADPRHAELVLRELGLTTDSKGSTTTGVKSSTDDDEDQELNKEEATMYRSISARMNYMCADRADLQFAVKELCRDMSAPTTRSWGKLKRLGRYLKDNIRLEIIYKFQEEQSTIDLYADTDYAGCTRSRKSTNGGCAMRGAHCLRTWSSTQSVIALSSGEAEYYGLTKAGCLGLGIKSLYKDFGHDVQIIMNLHTDSTAAKGIASRKGLGKLRHIEVQYLWLQDHIAKRHFILHKILGVKNPADTMTKYLSVIDIVKHMRTMNMEYTVGRSGAAPAIV